MTNQQHPITPPTELVEQWRNLPEYTSELRMMSAITITTEKLQDIATKAARWGADQELDACCEWLEDTNWDELREAADDLRADRRPKPEGPTDEELRELWNDGWDTSEEHGAFKFARAVLARWGQPSRRSNFDA